MLESIAPAAGPTEGGTLVRIYGSHLHGGPLAARAVIAAGVAYSTSRLCRFGDGTEPVPASHDAAHGALTLIIAPTLTPNPNPNPVPNPTPNPHQARCSAARRPTPRSRRPARCPCQLRSTQSTSPRSRRPPGLRSGFALGLGLGLGLGSA